MMRSHHRDRADRSFFRLTILHFLSHQPIMDLVFLGIQGSGKGTQAKRLAEEFGYHLFEAGLELRKLTETDTDTGRAVKSFIDQGNLVPYQFIIDVVRMVTSSLPANTRILFDGIPRDEEQKREFDQMIQEKGRDFRVIHFVLDKETGLKRIHHRAKTEGRKDDLDEAFILKRINWSIEKTEPIVEKYRAQGKVIDVDASGTVDEVYEILKKAVTGIGA